MSDRAAVIWWPKNRCCHSCTSREPAQRRSSASRSFTRTNRTRFQGRYYSLAAAGVGLPGPGAAVRVRGRPRPLLGLQGVRGGLPRAQRARRGRGLADVGLLVGGHVGAAGAPARHHRLPPLPRPGLPLRLPGRRLREGPGHRDRQAPRRPVHRLPVLHRSLPVRRPQVPRGKRGIVRKCDMCSDRLAAGEAPACVQACPHRGDPDPRRRPREVVAGGEANAFLPGAPEPGYTLPTTRYQSDARAAAQRAAGRPLRGAPEHAHAPLVVMLVLTQMSVGAFVVDLCSARAAIDAGAAPAVRWPRRAWSRLLGHGREPAATSAARCTPSGR